MEGVVPLYLRQPEQGRAVIAQELSGAWILELIAIQNIGDPDARVVSEVALRSLAGPPQQKGRCTGWPVVLVEVHPHERLALPDGVASGLQPPPQLDSSTREQIQEEQQQERDPSRLLPRGYRLPSCEHKTDAQERRCR